MTPPTRYRYAGGYNWCVGGVMTPPYRVRSTLIQLCDKYEFEYQLPTKNGSAAQTRFSHFFIYSLTIFSTSSGVSMGLAISFLGQTAAHRPQEVHLS